MGHTSPAVNPGLPKTPLAPDPPLWTRDDPRRSVPGYSAVGVRLCSVLDLRNKAYRVDADAPLRFLGHRSTSGGVSRFEHARRHTLPVRIGVPDRVSLT